jgi:NCAIR mutase (PurE)-related protein
MGLPEVIYAAGKTAEQVVAVFSSLATSGVDVLATRVNAATAEAVLAQHPDAGYSPTARTVSLRQGNETAELQGHVAVVCAGSSDLFVAEEAAVTVETFHARVTRLYDVGVAGIHRLLAVGGRAAVGGGWAGGCAGDCGADVGGLWCVVCRGDRAAGNAELVQPERDRGQYR